MHKVWLSEAGYRLVLQQYSTGRAFVWLFFEGQCMLSHEYDYTKKGAALKEAESLADLGRMREEGLVHDAA